MRGFLARVLQSGWFRCWIRFFALVYKTGLRCGCSHPRFCLFVSQMHLQANDFGVFLTGRDMQILYHLPHWADFVCQSLCCDFDFIELELLHLLITLSLLLSLSLPILLKSRLPRMKISAIINSCLIIQKFWVRDHLGFGFVLKNEIPVTAGQYYY